MAQPYHDDIKKSFHNVPVLKYYIKLYLLLQTVRVPPLFLEQFLILLHGDTLEALAYSLTAEVIYRSLF